MAKVTNEIGCKIEIFPERVHYGVRDANQLRQACEDMVKQIQRHVDGVRSVAIVPILQDECAECGDPWEYGSDECPCEKN